MGEIDGWPVRQRLVVYCGAPGSGKSTHSRRFPRGDILSTHDLRVSAEPAGASYWRRMLVAAKGRLDAGRGVVVDACNTRSGLRRMWLQLEVPALLVVMRTDPQLCRAAQAGREFPVPTAVVSRYCRELEVALRREIPVERWDDVVIVKR